MRFLIALLLALWAAAAQAQSIEGPDEVPAGEPAWFAIVDVPEGSAGLFVASDELQTDALRIVSGNALFWSNEPGPHVIGATVTELIIDWDKRTWAMRQTSLRKRIEVTGEAPPDPFRNPYPEPSQDWQSLLAPVLRAHPPRAYALDRAKRFSRFAESVRLGDVSTVGELSTLMSSETAEGTHPATKKAVGDLLTERLGRADVPLNEHAEPMLMAIAWALVEGSTR